MSKPQAKAKSRSKPTGRVVLIRDGQLLSIPNPRPEPRLAVSG